MASRRIARLRVKLTHVGSAVNSVLCGRWAHDRCALVKRATPMVSRNFTCRKCEGNIGETVELEDKLCDAVETVWKFIYLGDRVSAGGGCEAAVTARTRCGLVKFMECSELLFSKIFPLRLKGTVYRSNARLAILCGSEPWCLTEGEL